MCNSYAITAFHHYFGDFNFDYDCGCAPRILMICL